MQRRHMPRVDGRYWAAITLASIFGTNLGDLYAHESGLGIVPGLLILAALAAATFVVEQRDRRMHELYYWLVIIIIRTGATNIADYLAFRVRVPGAVLTVGLAAILATLAWRASHTARAARIDARSNDLPDTGALYWSAMLTAGVFGTVVGDIWSHMLGQEIASIGLGVILAVALLLGGRRAASLIGIYWLIVAIARTAGTAIGDWLAENPQINIGLPLSTLITGLVFVAILTIVRRDRTFRAP